MAIKTRTVFLIKNAATEASIVKIRRISERTKLDLIALLVMIS